MMPDAAARLHTNTRIPHRDGRLDELVIIADRLEGNYDAVCGVENAT